MDIDFNKNEDINKQLVYDLNTRLKKVRQGGGEKAAAKQKEKGKMLARERVAYLIDKDKPWLEMGAFVAEGMYAEHGGCPSGVVVCGIGYVSGRQCVVV
ncbi:MAG: carboxyl transferase domain-containing protein, partial [Mucilaginibacter sp.]